MYVYAFSVCELNCVQMGHKKHEELGSGKTLRIYDVYWKTKVDTIKSMFQRSVFHIWKCIWIKWTRNHSHTHTTNNTQRALFACAKWVSSCMMYRRVCLNSWFVRPLVCWALAFTFCMPWIYVMHTNFVIVIISKYVWACVCVYNVLFWLLSLIWFDSNLIFCPRIQVHFTTFNNQTLLDDFIKSFLLSAISLALSSFNAVLSVC